MMQPLKIPISSLGFLICGSVNTCTATTWHHPGHFCTVKPYRALDTRKYNFMVEGSAHMHMALHSITSLSSKRSLSSSFSKCVVYCCPPWSACYAIVQCCHGVKGLVLCSLSNLFHSPQGGWGNWGT